MPTYTATWHDRWRVADTPSKEPTESVWRGGRWLGQTYVHQSDSGAAGLVRSSSSRVPIGAQGDISRAPPPCVEIDPCQSQVGLFKKSSVPIFGIPSPWKCHYGYGKIHLCQMSSQQLNIKILLFTTHKPNYVAILEKKPLFLCFFLLLLLVCILITLEAILD